MAGDWLHLLGNIRLQRGCGSSQQASFNNVGVVPQDTMACETLNQIRIERAFPIGELFFSIPFLSYACALSVLLSLASLIVFPLSAFAGDRPKDGNELAQGWLEQEKDPAYQATWLEERRSLERALSATSEEDTGAGKLEILSRLGRSYLGTSLIRFGRDEKQAREIIQRIRKEYTSREFSALVLHFDLTASLRN